MQLIDVINDLDELPDDLIIYAELIDGQWTADSKADVVPIPEDGAHLRSVGQEHEGMTYMLEVFIARDVLDDWTSKAGTTKITDDIKLRVIAYYAEHDAYPTYEAIMGAAG